MNLRTIPRAAVGGYIKAVRWPLDRAATMLGRDTLGLDRAEAAAREAAGAVLGDDQILRDAGRRRTAVTQREHAEELRTQAEQRKEQAQRQTKARKQSAAAAERRGVSAARKTAAKQEEAIDDRAKRERLATLEKKSEALDKQEDALPAADEAQRLQDAAAKTKARRKAAAER